MVWKPRTFFNSLLGVIKGVRAIQVENHSAVPLQPFQDFYDEQKDIVM